MPPLFRGIGDTRDEGGRVLRVDVVARNTRGSACTTSDPNQERPDCGQNRRTTQAWRVKRSLRLRVFQGLWKKKTALALVAGGVGAFCATVCAMPHESRNYLLRLDSIILIRVANFGSVPGFSPVFCKKWPQPASRSA
jgi:hypothetical protein